MPRRVWSFRVLGLAFLALALLVAVVGVAAFPYNSSPFLSRKGLGSPAEAGEYYTQIGAPATFAAWYAEFFPAGGDRRADAIYYNAGDLGFGREMHCREETSFTSCYVANHGLGAGAPQIQAVIDAVTNARILPTVAMVYDYTIEGQPNDVAFYVYGTDGNLLTQVALDSEGAKNVPHLCLPCHGGTYDSGTNSVTGANFLPFDAASFTYSSVPAYTRAGQEQAFRVLNSMVEYTFPGAQISGLIAGWYADTGGVNTPGAVLDNDYTPPAYDGNAADRELYHEVVKHYCRGCHISQTFNLADPADVDGSGFYSVFDAMDMPHAQMTAHNFWSSGAPSVLARRFPETFRVTTTADSTPNGCTPDNCTLREAVIAANANADLSVIVFDVDGTFVLERTGANEDLASTGDLDLREDVIILGNGAEVTQLNAAALDRFFHIQNGAEVLIQRLTVRGGGNTTNGLGSGLLVDYNSQLTLNLSVVRNNTGPAGGFAGNGLALRAGSVVEINQSSFIANLTAGSGTGGAILNDEGTLRVNDSTISGNSAGQGGGIYTAYAASTNVRFSTVISNFATTSGGGLVVMGSSVLTVTNSIVSGNTAPASANCLVTSATYTSQGFNLVGHNGATGGCPTIGSDQVLAGPVSAVARPLGTETFTGLQIHRPVFGSVVVDAIPLGANCATPSYDNRNQARPLDANNDGDIRCDIGATEAAIRSIYLPQIGR